LHNVRACCPRDVQIKLKLAGFKPFNSRRQADRRQLISSTVDGRRSSRPLAPTATCPVSLCSPRPFSSLVSRSSRPHPPLRL
jgi:hypothetical protein